MLMKNLIRPLRPENLTPDVMLRNIAVEDCHDKKYALVLAVCPNGEISIYENNIPKGILKMLAIELLEYTLVPENS